MGSIKSVFFASGWCALMFRSVNISTKPPEMLPLAVLVVIAGTLASALLGGWLGECVADLAIEKSEK